MTEVHAVGNKIQNGEEGFVQSKSLPSSVSDLEPPSWKL